MLIPRIFFASVGHGVRLIRCKRWASLYYHEKISPVRDSSRGIDGWIIVISEPSFYDLATDPTILVLLPSSIKKKERERDTVIASLTAAKLPSLPLFFLSPRLFDSRVNRSRVVKRIPRYFVAFQTIWILYFSNQNKRKKWKKKRKKFEIKFIICNLNYLRNARANSIFQLASFSLSILQYVQLW